MRLAFLLLFTTAALALSQPAPAPRPVSELDPFPHPKGYVCHRAAKPITIDGQLTDAEWAAAPWTDAFADIEGDAKPKPRHRTRAKMLWDADALYIAAELDEPHVWGTLTEHDAVIFHDNDFEVFIDPDGDNHNYAELELNALNTTWDLLLTKPYKDTGGRVINNWEIHGLKTAVKVNGTLNNTADTDTGWTLEIRVPFKSMGELGHLSRDPKSAVPKDGDHWRINFSRVEWDTVINGGKYEKVKGRPEHNWVWSPQGVVDMHRPERWGYLHFTTGEPGKVAFAPDPDWARRDLLHRVYYAQKRHFKQHKSYAATTAELGLNNLPDSVTIERTRTGFEAWVREPWADARTPKRWTIHQDSRFVVE